MNEIKLIVKILKEYKCSIILVLLALGCISIPWIIGQDLWYYAPINHELFGTYGDFIGGVLGTIFAAIAVFYAVKTYVKDKNDAIREQEISELNKQKEKIGNHFYTMLTKHNEYSYYLIEGEENYFPKSIELLRAIFESCKNNTNIKMKERDIFKLSYLYFFYGNKIHADLIPDKRDVIEEMNQYFQNNNIKFEGVSIKLGIYFRQLYQIITYVDEKDKEILSYEEKYHYIKSLRATLGNEEQYLFFLNSLSTLGEIWELTQPEKNDKLITKYNLIKNISLNFPRIFGDNDFEDEYPKIHYEYEESDEVRKREREQWEEDYT